MCLPILRLLSSRAGKASVQCLRNLKILLVQREHVKILDALMEPLGKDNLDAADFSLFLGDLPF